MDNCQFCGPATQKDRLRKRTVDETPKILDWKVLDWKVLNW